MPGGLNLSQFGFSSSCSAESKVCSAFPVQRPAALLTERPRAPPQGGRGSRLRTSEDGWATLPPSHSWVLCKPTKTTKTNPTRKAKSILFIQNLLWQARRCGASRVSRDRTAGGVGKLPGHKGSSRCGLGGGRWHREAVGGLTRSLASCGTGWGCVFGFLWLVLS